MSRKFISLVVAASVAVAGLSASQAQAERKHTRNLILGAAALAILGAAASNANRDRGAPATTAQPRHRNLGDNRNGRRLHRSDRDNAHGDSPGRVRNHGRNPDANPRRDRRPAVTPRPLPPRVSNSGLPRRCLVTVENRRGRRDIYEQRCLQRHYSQAHILPQHCRTRVRAAGQRIRGYDPSCVRQHNRTTRWLNRH